jgi:Ni/Fe-hydrogenase subunit HybB-like protein
MTRARKVLILISVIGLAAIAYRMFYGLGAATNLSNRWPWGMWVWWDVMTGVALAGGGYGTALLVNFMGREKWRDVERAALLTSWLGYVMVLAGLFLDLGRWTNVWRIPLIWTQNPHSVMFELVWCVSGYTFVQTVEMGHIFVERLHMPRLAKVLHKIYVPTLVIGILLPLMHQSALGSLYVIANGRLDPMWWTMLLPLFFLVSSFYVGPSMVTLENSMASKAHHREPPHLILREMEKLAGLVMSVYLAARVTDLAVRGQLGRVFSGTVQGDMMLLELVVGVAIPVAIFLTPRLRNTPKWLVTGAALAVLGVALQRANVVFTAMAASARGAVYYPSPIEIAVTCGIVAIGILSYVFIMENFPIAPAGEEGVQAEEMAIRRARQVSAHPAVVAEPSRHAA